jgi:8-oxo-dGTP diphosphatase
VEERVDVSSQWAGKDMKMATLCYVLKGNDVLMVHRVKKAQDMHHGKWNGLGGKLEPGETPEECARREIREESGLEVNELTLKGILTFPGFANDEDWYAFVFVAGAVHAALIDSPEGVLKWVSREELFDLNLWEGDRIFLPWIFQAGFFSGKFVYKDGHLEEHSAVKYL